MSPDSSTTSRPRSIGPALADKITCSVDPMSYVDNIMNSIVILYVSCMDVKDTIYDEYNQQVIDRRYISSHPSLNLQKLFPSSNMENLMKLLIIDQ